MNLTEHDPQATTTARDEGLESSSIIRGAGQFTGGVVEVVAGGALVGGGGAAAGGGVAASVATGGVSLFATAAGGSAATAGWAAVGQGATSIVAGLATIADSLSLSTGSGSSGSQGTARAKGGASDIRWKGFSKESLSTHFKKHGADFGNISQSQYLNQAKTFAAEAGAFQEGQVGNIVVKYDPVTRRTFIGHTGSREIRTFYKADG